MAKVTLKNIYKIYDNNVTAVTDFNLDIEDKEFVVLVGPSGCGKSTTLRMVAGLEEISKGDVFIGERRVNDVDPKDRNIAMVFQNYALYPHMTVYENMAFGLKLRKLPKDEIDSRVKEAAMILGIEQYLKRKPKELSGGQRQRVAIGRAIVREPEVFLMDEPLSNLDAKLRNQMRAEILKLHKKLNTTFIYVTHDQVEAMTLGDRIVVMKDGLVQQIATPKDIFESPSNMFVAGFIGTPQMNFLDAKLMKVEDEYVVNVFGKNLKLSDEKSNILKEKNIQPKEVILGIRPEHMDITEAEENSIRVKVEVTELIGSEAYLHIKNEGKAMVARVSSEHKIESDDVINLLLNPSKLHLFDKETEENLFVKEI